MALNAIDNTISPIYAGSPLAKGSLNGALAQTVQPTPEPTPIIADPVQQRLRGIADNRDVEQERAENSVSILQTADAWLGKMGNLLERMQGFAEEASTASANDREKLQVLFEDFQKQLADIPDSSATFQGQKLLDGSYTPGQQVDAGTPPPDQQVTLRLPDLTSDSTLDIGGGVEWAKIVDATSTNLTEDPDEAAADVESALDYINGLQQNISTKIDQVAGNTRSVLDFERALNNKQMMVRSVDDAIELSQRARRGVLDDVSGAMRAQVDAFNGNALQLLLPQVPATVGA